MKRKNVIQRGVLFYSLAVIVLTFGILVVHASADAQVIQIGSQPGFVTTSVSYDQPVELMVNSTNTSFDVPWAEWFIFSAIVKGQQMPIDLISTYGVYLLSDVADALLDYTFPFNPDGVTSLGQHTMSDFGLDSGDTLLYAYAYMNQKGVVVIENVVSITVK